MDPVTLIVTALATGAAEAGKDTVVQGAKDAYEGLKGLLRRRLQGREAAEVALDKHQTRPDVWEAPLKAELSEAGADQDEDVVRAAGELMALLKPQDAAAGRFNTHIEGGVRGLVQGDNNTVQITFGDS